MRKDMLIEGAEISRNAAEPGRAAALSRDEVRAFLTFCLAASLLWRSTPSPGPPACPA